MHRMYGVPVAVAVVVTLAQAAVTSAQDHHGAAPPPATAREAAKAAARPAADAQRDTGRRDTVSAAPGGKATADNHGADVSAGGHAGTGTPKAAHAPSAKPSGHDPDHAAPAAANPPHGKTPRKAPAPEPAAKVEGAAPGTTPPAAGARRPAAGKELDAVMDRISRRISAYSDGRGGSHAAVTEPEHAEPRSPAPSRGNSRGGRTEPPLPRVRLSWKPTIVWPAALLPPVPNEGLVNLHWDPLPQ